VRQLLPETFEVVLELPRGELLDIVRRAAVMAQRNAPLRLRFADGALTVTAQSQDVGETSESLPAPYTADPLEIGFNADFLREGLESVQSETVQVKLINPLRPGLLSAEGDAFWYLIMPIRLAG
jgi:DNA polymerase-3 subunit beta